MMSCLAASSPLVARAQSSNPLAGFDEYVIKGMQDWKIPGVAIGIVKNDSVIYAKGFGVRTFGKPEKVDGSARVQKAEVDMAKSLVENLSSDFKPEKYDDTYRKELMDLIRAKAKGAKLPEPQEEEEGEVVDLMEALRASVKETQKGTKRKKKARKAS